MFRVIIAACSPCVPCNSPCLFPMCSLKLIPACSPCIYSCLFTVCSVYLFLPVLRVLRVTIPACSPCTPCNLSPHVLRLCVNQTEDLEPLQLSAFREKLIVCIPNVCLHEAIIIIRTSPLISSAQ